MKYERLMEVNAELETTDIKGKDYVEVNKRILAFKKLYEEGSIETNIISLDNGVITMRAVVRDNDGKIIATGTAQEKESSSFINKTSFVENCETSAVGRALGIAGIGIGKSVASKEEVENAILQQNATKKINKTQATALQLSITNAGIEEDVVKEILNKYGLEEISEEITMAQYVDIVADFRKLIDK